MTDNLHDQTKNLDIMFDHMFLESKSCIAKQISLYHCLSSLAVLSTASGSLKYYDLDEYWQVVLAMVDIQITTIC